MMLEDYINDKINEAYDFMQNDSKKALEIFDEILEIEPSNIEAINGKGSTLIKLGKLDEAEKYFNRSLSISPNSSALLNKGIIHKYKNNSKKALDYYEKALEINPKLYNIVNILKSEISKTIEVNMIEFSDSANLLIQRGIDLKNQGRQWDALETFMKAIEEDSNCKILADKQINEIKSQLEKKFIYDNEKFDIRRKIDRLKIQALRALFKEKDSKKALTLMDLVLELDANDINMLNHKGGALFICSEYEKAIECFDKCLSINKDYNCALFNKAIVLRIMNKLPESLNCFEKLLKIEKYAEIVKPYHSEILEKIRNE